MPQGNFAAYSPQEQIAAARQLLASRGLPINADNLNRAMHALYTNSDFVPPATVARALPLPPEFPEQAAPREVRREQPPSEQPLNQTEDADRARAAAFFLSTLPRATTLAPSSLPIPPTPPMTPTADIGNRFQRLYTPTQPSQPDTTPSRTNTQNNTSTRRLTRRARRQNAAESN